MDLVGAPVIIVARTSKAFELLLIGCQVKVLPFATVATKTCPKLSNDQLAGSSAKAVDREASPQPVNTYTNAPLLCAAVLVPFTALVSPGIEVLDNPV